MNDNEHVHLVVSSAPATEPLSTAEAKSHLRLTHNADNANIAALIKTVRLSMERLLNRALITQTLKAYYEAWPTNYDYVLIPRPPVVSVTTVKYTDYEGTVTTWDSDDYIVDIKRGRVVLAYEENWPTDTLYPTTPIEVEFIAGYGAATAVPDEIKWMLRLGIERIYTAPPETHDKRLQSLWSDYLYGFKAWPV